MCALSTIVISLSFMIEIVLVYLLKFRARLYPCAVIFSVCSLPLIPRIAVSSYVVRCYALLRLISLNVLRASFRSMRSDIASTLRSVVAVARLDFCALVLL